jgi:hypothetical protein
MTHRYTVEAKTTPNMIYVGIILIVINMVLFFSGKRINDVNHITKEKVIVEIIMYAIAFGLAIWAIIVAKKLNRSRTFWGIITFIFTPIALIILGIKDVAIHDDLRKIFNKYKSEYFLEKLKLEKDLEKGKIDKMTHDEKIKKILIEYDNAMNAEIKQMEIRMEEKHKEIVVEKVVGNGRAIIVKDKCPACETKISADTDVCPDCGLTLR